MEKRKLPKRFWTIEEYLEGENRYIHTGGMKSADFKKYYNKIVNPKLKAQNFKCEGYKAFKSDDLFYYMIESGFNKYGGRCVVSFRVQPIGFASEYGIEWDEERFKKDPSLYLFKRDFHLENKQEWIDVGSNEKEAIETCSLIEKDIVEQQQIYFSQFTKFKEDFSSINPKQFSLESLKEMMKHYGLLGLHGESAILWLANFHLFHKSVELAKDFAQLAKDLLIESARKEDIPPHKMTMERIQSVLSK